MAACSAALSKVDAVFPSSARVRGIGSQQRPYRGRLLAASVSRGSCRRYIDRLMIELSASGIASNLHGSENES